MPRKFSVYKQQVYKKNDKNNNVNSRNFVEQKYMIKEIVPICKINMYC